jgi:O-antigen/teichoic acid export membrane protein
MNTEKANLHLTSGRLLARNTIWNLLGQILPMAVGLVTIPLLIRGMGVERFGLLSLAWTLIGYLSLVDLGIGRALTKFVADKLGANEEHSIPSLAWTCLFLLFLLGFLGTAMIMISAQWLVSRVLKIPDQLQSETLQGMYILAGSIPLVTVTSGLRGILDAQQKFRLATLIRIPLSIFSFIGPLLVLPFSNKLVSLFGVLLISRLIGAIAHLWACFHTMPALRHAFALNRSLFGPVLKFGGWMTVSNVIGPLMFYMDRFLISSVLSVSAVAYYTVPFDFVSRLTIIPGAVVGVLFPAFAVSLIQDPERPSLLLGRALKYVFLIVFPLVLLAVTYAPEGLRFWLGPTFSQNSTSVLRWIAAGVLVNSLSTLPFVLIQGAGRPDIAAKLHIAELPVYLGVVWLLTKGFGIEGTAVAWTVRITIDAFLLFYFSYGLLPQKPKFLKKLGFIAAGGTAILYLATLPANFLIRSIFLLGSLVAFGVISWSWGLAPSERVYLVGSRVGALIRFHPN